MAIVYQHLRKDTKEVFYVGISKNNIRRPYIKSDRSDLWRKIANKYGYIVDIITKDISYEAALNMEKFLIRHYGKIYDNTGILSNFTDGGDKGVLGLKMSKNTKLRLSESLKNRYLLNPDLNASGKGALRAYCTSDAHRQLNSKRFSKKVQQLTLEGVFIKEYKSMEEAALFVGGYSGNISKVCSGKLKSSKGFKWRKV